MQQDFSNSMSFEFATPESAEKFINNVRNDNSIKSHVRFFLSAKQKTALKKLKRTLRRPNEASLNVKAFLLVLFCGIVLSVIFNLLDRLGFHQPLNTTFITIGILVTTLSGALAVLGIPSLDSSTRRLKNIRLACDDGYSDTVKELANQSYNI